MGSPASRILLLVLLAGGAASASAAHLKPASVEPLDASFGIGASGTIEASLNPPIQGVLRIIVRARESAGSRHPQNQRRPLTLEVTQWDRTIPFRLVHQSGHHLFGDRRSSLVADIDVNDLTPGVAGSCLRSFESHSPPGFCPARSRSARLRCRLLIRQSLSQAPRQSDSTRKIELDGFHRTIRCGCGGRRSRGVRGRDGCRAHGAQDCAHHHEPGPYRADELQPCHRRCRQGPPGSRG